LFQALKIQPWWIMSVPAARVSKLVPRRKGWGMPLVAFLDGQRIDSYLATDQHWDHVKKEYKTKGLTMACGLPGVPRRSKLGLKHFAHKAGVQCGLLKCWSESPQHTAAKVIIAGAAAEAGWEVTVECREAQGAWVADVLVEKDGRRIALEVQWSRQDAEEFSRRQERYAAHGVECFWYVHRRNRDAAERAGVPHLAFESDGAPFGVMAEEAFQEAEGVELRDHVAAFLGGFHRDRIQARITSVTIQYLYDTCWACKRSSTIWRISGAALLSRCQQTADFIRTGSPAWPTERIESLVADNVRGALGRGNHPPLARLRMHYSKTIKKRSLAYGCAHCLVGFFGDGFLAQEDDWESIAVPVSVWMPLSENILAQVHLCRDEGFGPCNKNMPQHSGPTFDGHVQGRNFGRKRVHPDATDDARTGTEISTRNAIALMTGNSYPRHQLEGSPSSPYRQGKAKEQPEEKASCDRCGTPSHPEYECLWRQFRAKAKVEPEASHYSDGVYAKIASGRISEDEGRAMMKRFIERYAPIPRR
jgi:hypothetical protein